MNAEARVQTPFARQQARQASVVRGVAWVIFLASAVGIIWIWSVTGGNGDAGTHVVVTIMLGILWVAIVSGVVALVVGALGFGAILFRRPR